MYRLLIAKYLTLNDLKRPYNITQGRVIPQEDEGSLQHEVIEKYLSGKIYRVVDLPNIRKIICSSKFVEAFSVKRISCAQETIYQAVKS